MAMHAHPVPVDPYNPSSAASASEGAPIIHPSPYVPIRLRVFAPVIFLNDCIVSVLGELDHGIRSPLPSPLGSTISDKHMSEQSQGNIL